MRTQDEYRGDVIYDVWRAGGNPDRVDYDRVNDYYIAGLEEDDAVVRELRRQRRYYAPSDPAAEEEPQQ